MTRGKWGVFCWLLCERCETFASHYAAAASPAKMNLLAGRQLERWGLSPWILNRFIKVSTYKLVRRSFATYIFKLSSYFGFRRYGRGGGGGRGSIWSVRCYCCWQHLASTSRGKQPEHSIHFLLEARLFCILSPFLLLLTYSIFLSNWCIFIGPYIFQNILNGWVGWVGGGRAAFSWRHTSQMERAIPGGGKAATVVISGTAQHTVPYHHRTIKYHRPLQ